MKSEVKRYPRMLFVFPSSFLGGSELSVLETIKSLVDKVEMYAVLPYDGALRERLAPFCKEVAIIDYPWWVSSPAWNTNLKFKMIKRFVSSTWAFYRYIKAIKANVVITNTLTIPSAALASKAARIPHIWYIHELGEEDHGLIFNYGRLFSLWLMNRTSRLFIVNSENVRRKFSKVFTDKIRLINQAVELSSTVNHDKKNLYDIIFLGRVSKGKNPEDLIRALSILKNDDCKLSACFIGRRDKSYYEYLLALTEKLDVRSQITFKDFQENVSDALSSAKIFVMCSPNEAFGRVTIESMKCKVPVIVTNSGSGPDIIDEGVTGLLYQFQDPMDLAKKIKFYLSHEQERQIMAERAFLWANENFNSAKHSSEMFDTIKEAIQ